MLGEVSSPQNRMCCSTTEVDGDLFLKKEKERNENENEISPYNSSGAVQVSRSPKVPKLGKDIIYTLLNLCCIC